MERKKLKRRNLQRALFSGAGNLENVPTSAITKDALNRPILDVLVELKILPSKGEGKRLIQQNGLSINDTKIADINRVLVEEDFKNGYALIKRGKKNYNRIVIE